MLINFFSRLDKRFDQNATHRSNFSKYLFEVTMYLKVDFDSIIILA